MLVLFVGYDPKDFTEDKAFWLTHIHPDDKQLVLEMFKDLSTPIHKYSDVFL